MIVDKSKKIICLHNPKSGGTFLRDTYIKEHGETVATRWWYPYSEVYNTDLGHITYGMLSRFVPDWKDYRIYVMVRNPYNRFVSALKEARVHCKTDIVNTCLDIRLFDSPKMTYKCPYLLKSILATLKSKDWRTLKPLLSIADRECLLRTLLAKDYYKQDLLIRNKRIPWLNPQSEFIGDDVRVLRYESAEDWGILADTFELHTLNDKLAIQKDYELSVQVKEMIRKLYFEDEWLFSTCY